ncbi:MAG: hypothetical protein MJ150_02325, partial [Clostridia bacterium]|nr:hypothetical protein [Clostridia bacterium]
SDTLDIKKARARFKEELELVLDESDNDILVRIIVKKEAAKIAYNAVRVQSTDFPMLTCSVCKTDKAYRIAIGARPAKACLVEADLNEKDIPNYVASKVRTGSNFKGSAEYRKHLVKVLTERCLAMLEVQNGN